MILRLIGGSELLTYQSVYIQQLWWLQPENLTKRKTMIKNSFLWSVYRQLFGNLRGRGREYNEYLADESAYTLADSEIFEYNGIDCEILGKLKLIILQ